MLRNALNILEFDLQKNSEEAFLHTNLSKRVTCYPVLFWQRGGGGYLPARADFHFFHWRGGIIFGGVQVICNMPFLML